MTCDRMAAVLDDFLDGGAGAPGRASIDAHLLDCASCRALVADMRAIRTAARTLEPVEPPAHVWRGVEARLAAEARAARRSAASTDTRAWTWGSWFRAWRPLAATAALAVVVSSLAWLGARLDQPAGPQPSSRADSSGDESHLAGFRLAEAQYSDAIARLEEATAAAGPRALDGVTSVTLRSSIDDIDSAIGEARDALARQPDDELSQESLLDALGSKVALLQDTVALLGETDERSEERNP